jgi:hypothetical protein
MKKIKKKPCRGVAGTWPGRGRGDGEWPAGARGGVAGTWPDGRARWHKWGGRGCAFAGAATAERRATAAAQSTRRPQRSREVAPRVRRSRKWLSVGEEGGWGAGYIPLPFSPGWWLQPRLKGGLVTTQDFTKFWGKFFALCIDWDDWNFTGI